MKRIAVYLITAAIIVGCIRLTGKSLGRTEIGSRRIVEAIGLDSCEKGVRLLLQVPDLSKHGTQTGASGGEQKASLYVYEANTLGQALTMAGEGTGEAPLYSQARILVLGRALAQRNVRALLDPFLRRNMIRSDLLIAVADKKAEDVLSVSFHSTSEDASVVEQAVRRGEEEGKNVCTPLFQFLSLLYENEGAACCPVISHSGEAGEAKRIDLKRTAFFRNDALSFVIDGELTQGLLLLNGRMQKGTLTVKTAKGVCVLQIVGAGRKWSFGTGDGAGTPRLRLNVRADLLEFLPANGVNTAPDRDAISAAAKDSVNDLVRRTMEKLYGNGADACRLRKRSRIAAAAGRDVYNFSPTELSIRSVDIQTDVILRRFGKTVLPSKE